jgi:hypothetical protein
LKILVDNSVRHHAVALNGEWVDTGNILWGGGVQTETGYVKTFERGAKVRKVHGGDPTRHLASLAKHYASLGLSFHTTDALSLETFSQPAGRYVGEHYGDVSLFSVLKFEKHTTLPNLSFSIPHDDPVEELRTEIARQRSSLFKEIRDELNRIKPSKKSSQDAWHLTCTQNLALDCFLTCDNKLISQVESFQNAELRKILKKLMRRPHELCDQLRVKPLSDQEFAEFTSSLPGTF